MWKHQRDRDAYNARRRVRTKASIDRENEARKSIRRGQHVVLESQFHIPEATLEEWERVKAAPLTPSMTLLGDPPPGRSALDRRC